MSIKIMALKFMRRLVRRIAIIKLENNQPLWKELISYKSKTISTGCSWSDYWELYNTVRMRKPREILECGPGVSTLIMAYALMENKKEGYPGRITAMEELDVYLQKSLDLLPEYLQPYVEFNLSPRIEDYYYLFRGVRYSNIPDRQYDFVFVDGPELNAPSDGALTFDFDFIRVVMNSEKPVYGIVDYRLSTSYVFQTVFGLDKVKFDAIRELAFVGPCTEYDLKQLDLESLTTALIRSAKLFRNTEIRLG